MPIEWAGFGPELLVTIDRDNGAGLRAQLEDQLRDAIRGGRVAVGERLPSSREFAAACGCLVASSRTATHSCRPRAI